MPSFRYKAVARTGEVVEGELDAPDHAAAVVRLQTSGLFPMETETIPEAAGRPGGTAAAAAGTRTPGPRPSRHLVALFTRELAILLGAGVTLDRALAIAGEVQAKESARAMFRRVRGRVVGGSPLSEALAAEGFDAVYLAMLRAGEAGGTLERVLARLAEVLERSEAVRQSVRGALIYPAIVMGVAFLSGLVLIAIVLPRFRAMFQELGKAVPPATQFMLDVAAFLDDYGWALILAAVAAFLAGRLVLARPAARAAWDKAILGLPLVGDLVVKIDIERMSRLLGTLIANGVALPQALGIAAAAAGNRAIGEAVEGAVDSVIEGRGLSEALAASGRVPALAVELVRIGEETGKLETMLLELARIYDRELQTATNRLVALLTPALTILLGVVIGAIVLSLVSAVMDIYAVTL